MKKTTLLSISILLMTMFLFPQTYTGSARIIGYVYDEQGKPIEGAKVKLFCVKAEGGFEVETDKDGKWVANGIRGGTWNLDFEKPGYMPRKISLEVKEFRRNPKIEVRLKKAEGLVVAEGLKDELKKGDELYEGGKYLEAIQAYEKILEKFPDATMVNKNIGNCFFSQRKYDQAIEYYKEVLDKYPDDTSILMAIGNCYTNKGENDKAMEWYNKIEFDKIDDPIVLYNIGSGFYTSSKLDMALKYYKRAVEIQEDFLDGIYQLGLTYLSLENHEQAIKTFENYLKHDSDSKRAAQVRGFLNYLRKK